MFLGNVKLDYHQKCVKFYHEQRGLFLAFYDSYCIYNCTIIYKPITQFKDNFPETYRSVIVLKHPFISTKC